MYFSQSSITVYVETDLEAMRVKLLGWYCRQVGLQQLGLAPFVAGIQHAATGTPHKFSRMCVNLSLSFPQGWAHCKHLA